MRIAIREEFGWRRVTGDRCVIWAKTAGRTIDTAELETALDSALTGRAGGPDAESIASFFDALDSHFALVAQGAGWTLAAVDPVRSTPLAWAAGADGWIVDDQADRLLQAVGLTQADISPDAAIAVAMAGYTIDVATLYDGLHQLGAGEYVLFRDGADPHRQRYYTYRPWRPDKPAFDAAALRRQLAEIALAVIGEMMENVGERELCVPLSAGNDSRLIVSAARHLGYKNVRTFAYGRAGSHEAKASKAIAERLGYPWRFVATDLGFMRRYYASADFRDYLRFADTAQSVPFVQDMPQIAALKESGYVPGDAVLANGNTGDFLSGGHVVPALHAPVPKGTSEAQRLEIIVQALYDKHFALWDHLRTPAHFESVGRQLRASIERAGPRPGVRENDFGLYEYAEFQDRQTKYVISGQRIYDFLGHEWRMPLWARGLLDFFEALPLDGKRTQRLYVDMLRQENWGGVWQGIPVNKETIRPHWMRPIRFAAKIAHAPLGRDRWHRFERRFFRYWMEPGRHTAFRAYRDVARDRRGARHGIAWLAERYLADHGVVLDDV